MKQIIAEIDRKLSEQINQILHHNEFQTLEGAWRGLHYLVTHTETDELLKIKALPASRNEGRADAEALQRASRGIRPLFRKIYEEEYGQFGGEPFGCLVGDFHFNHSPPDVEMLGELSKIAAAAHAPFIAGASPELMQMDSWQELSNPRDLTKIFRTPNTRRGAACGSRRIRATSASRCRAFSRGCRTVRAPIRSTNSTSRKTPTPRTTTATWANSAYAMAANINRSFKQFGWCSSIRGVESGGRSKGCRATFPTDDGGVDQKCPTEIAISDRREAELAKNGFMPFVHRKNSDFAAFIGAQSLYQPAEYHDPDATANARLSGRLPYLFACCRFAHYLKCIVRDKIGSFRERDDMERWLNDWIMNYVDGDPINSSQETKARKPLAAAQVVVDEVEDNPGYYTSKFFLRPHYQLEGTTVSLRLISRLPTAKAANE